MACVDEALLDALEVIRAIEPAVEENLGLLVPVDRAWQPADYLPDLEAENWREQVEGFRKSAMAISDELLVVLVGDMVTEEALPSYAISLNGLVRDHEGTSPAPWAKWLRGWTAEENRHGDLLNAYLRLTGRVDMRSIEVTVHHLLNNAFQERATKISHANVGKLAGGSGDAGLARICLKIAGDEARHEAFYTVMMGRVIDQDPDGGLISVMSMLRRVIAMPGRLMFDGKDPDLFDHFAAVAQRL